MQAPWRTKSIGSLVSGSRREIASCDSSFVRGLADVKKSAR
jgi:hypothetical protein